eukprot:PhF_6_TR17265/c0_g1_i1/m.26480
MKCSRFLTFPCRRIWSHLHQQSFTKTFSCLTRRQYCTSTAIPHGDITTNTRLVSDRSFRLRELHKETQDSTTRHTLESYAWKELSKLTNDGVDIAEGDEVLSLIHTWTYFAKYWDNGLDGLSAERCVPESKESEFETFMNQLMKVDDSTVFKKRTESHATVTASEKRRVKAIFDEGDTEEVVPTTQPAPPAHILHNVPSSATKVDPTNKKSRFQKKL